LPEAERTVEDRLREEYFTLLPEIRRVADRLEAEIRYHVLPISGALERHERLAVKCRVKSCESALEKLRARQEGRAFQGDRPEIYTLTSLNDLAGVRVLAFPRGRLAEIDGRLLEVFPSWTSDPVKDDGEVQALKYYGYCRQASDKVKGEYQIDADRPLLGSGAFGDLQTGCPPRTNSPKPWYASAHKGRCKGIQRV
jgi:hypothetical protein